MPLLPELRRENVGCAPILQGVPSDPAVAGVLEVVDDDEGELFKMEDVTSEGLEVVTEPPTVEGPVVVEVLELEDVERRICATGVLVDVLDTRASPLTDPEELVVVDEVPALLLVELVEVAIAPLSTGALRLLDVEDRVFESALSLAEPLPTGELVLVVALDVDPLSSKAAAALVVLELVVEEGDTTSICA